MPRNRLTLTKSGRAGLQVRTRLSCKKKRWSTPASPMPHRMSISARAVPAPYRRPMRSVFELKPGEVSQVFSDPGSFYIYKVVSVRQVPLSDVKATISSTLQRQMITDKIEQIQKSATVVLNDAYFGPEVPRTVQQTYHHAQGSRRWRTLPPPNAPPAPPPNPVAPPK